MRRIRLLQSGSAGGRVRLRAVLALAAVALLLTVVLSAGQGQSGPAMFTDIATSAMAEARTDSAGVCWADYDGDGDEDLFVTNAARHGHERNRLWRNDGGIFTEATDQAGMTSRALKNSVGCAFADLDGDGDLDFYVTAKTHKDEGAGDQENKLFRNDGDGTFADVTARARVGMPGVGSASSDWADFDNDGDLDGFVGARTLNDLNAFFEQLAPLEFRNIAEAKGLADPVGRRFTFMGNWFDYDADGDVDILLAIDFWGLELFRNDAGRFTRVTAAAFPPATDSTPGAPPNNPMGITWGDYDNDGCMDVFITGTNIPGQGGFGAAALGDLASRLYRNNCDGTFTDVTQAVGFIPTGLVEWSTSFIDYDNDGDLDLSVVAGNAADFLPPELRRVRGNSRRLITLIVNGLRRVIPSRLVAWAYRYEVMIPASGALGRPAAMPNMLYQNQLVETGIARFANVTAREGVANLGASRGSAWADFDNDGDLDWFISGRATANRLFRNNGPVGNYLRIHLVGERLKNAVGAWVRIKVRDGGRVATQIRHVHVLDGYLSQSQMAPHFGLGVIPSVEEVAVRWPGTTTWQVVCRSVPANRTITVAQHGHCRWTP